MYNYSDFKASVLGGIFSVVGLNGSVIDLSSALLYGAVGALGGWLMNKLLKYIDKKRNEPNKKI